MNEQDIEQYIVKHFNDVHPLDSWGEKSFFLNPNRQLKRGTYFATLKAKDGDHDNASYLNRKGVFRLNIGISKKCYISMFGQPPTRPAKGKVISGSYDFQQLNTILPHPVYGWMGWVCVLNPSQHVFEDTCKILLHDAYDKAMQATKKKLEK